MPDAPPPTRPPGSASPTTSGPPVRRGRGRVGQDRPPWSTACWPWCHGPGRAARRRRHHLHREGRRRAARPHPPRLEELGAEGADGVCRRPPLPHRARPARRGRHRDPARLRPAAAVRASGGGRAAAARRGARRGELDRGLRPALVGVPRPAAGRPRADSGPPAALRVPVPPPRAAGPGRWPSTRTGTSSRSGCPPTSPSPPPSGRCSTPASPPGGGRVREPCARPRLTSSAVRLDDLADYLDELGAIDRRARPARGALTPRPSRSRRASRSGGRAARPTSTTSRPSRCRAQRGGARRLEDMPQQGGRRVRPAHRQRHPPASPWTPPPSGAPPGSSSSTTCSCWPAPCCATRAHGPRCAPACTSATSGSCSTSSRTPTPSRSSWPCASPRPTPIATRPAPRRGTRWRSRPGHLFVVGDPKQSIYRFRRADISTFLAAADRFGRDGGNVVELTANFRTAAPVIEWVNTDLRHAS